MVDSILRRFHRDSPRAGPSLAPGARLPHSVVYSRVDSADELNKNLASTLSLPRTEFRKEEEEARNEEEAQQFTMATLDQHQVVSLQRELAEVKAQVRDGRLKFHLDVPTGIHSARARPATCHVAPLLT